MNPAAELTMRLELTVLAALTTLAGACANVTDPADIEGFSDSLHMQVDVAPSEEPAVEMPVVDDEVLVVEDLEAEQLEAEVDEVVEEELQIAIETPVVDVGEKGSHDPNDCPPCGRG